MTALLSILAVSALFALSALVRGRGGCDHGACGSSDACHSCGVRWFKENRHDA
jgi:hypothetical protein